METLIKENERLTKRLNEMESYLHDIARVYISPDELHRSLKLSDVYTLILEIINEVIGARSCAVMVVDEITGELKPVASRGQRKEMIKDISKVVDMRILEKVIKTGKPYIRAKSETTDAADKSTASKVAAPLCCYPFLLEKNVIGLFLIIDLLPQKKELTQQDLELLSLLTEHTAVSIVGARLYARYVEGLTEVREMLGKGTKEELLRKKLKSKEELKHELSSITTHERAMKELMKANQEVIALASELDYKNVQLERAKKGLKEKVEERTKELVDAHEKLVRHEKMAAMGKLASTTGHEIRGPLGVIRNSVEFLSMRLGKELDEKVKRHLAILSEEVNIINKIISDILDFARPKQLTFSTIDINSIIKDSIKKAIVPTNIKIVSKFQRDLLPIKADVSQIQRVISNITINAVQAMPKGGTFTVTTKFKKGFEEIEFRDTGAGIKKKDSDKIFEPLFSTKSKGTGLGLTVCQNIVHDHKGKIEVEGEEGKGSVFRVKLPVN